MFKRPQIAQYWRGGGLLWRDRTNACKVLIPVTTWWVSWVVTLKTEIG